MSFGLLRSRAWNISELSLIQKKKDYALFGEFYEDRTNDHGGADFLKEDLETFFKINPFGSEYGNGGRLKNYASQFSEIMGRTQVVTFLIPHTSREQYILKNYSLYKCFVYSPKP